MTEARYRGDQASLYSPVIVSHIVERVTGDLPDNTRLAEVFAFVFDLPPRTFFDTQSGTAPSIIHRTLLNGVKGLMRAGFSNVAEVRNTKPAELVDIFWERNPQAKMTINRAEFIVAVFSGPEAKLMA